MSLPTLIILIIVLILLLLLLLLWRLGAGLRHQWPFDPRYPVKEFLIQNEVVVAGPEDDVNRIMSSEPVASLVEGEVIHQLKFKDTYPEAAMRCANLPTDYMIALYRLKGKKPDLQQALTVINTTGGALVYAEPNRITGEPWDPEPGPWDPEPGGFRGPAAVGAASPADFAVQWGFDTIGLLDYNLRTGVPRGEKVIVGVFDTSPLKAEEEWEAFSWPMPEPYGKFDLLSRDIHDYSTMPSPARTLFPRTVIRKKPFNLSQHGLFVSGLVHSVAPKSSIRLMEVLDIDRRGSMFRLIVGVYEFMLSEIVPIYKAGDPVCAVMNFSLGIRIPPEDEATFTHIPDVYRAMRIFEHLMRLAKCMNIVVTAAAGNESDKYPAPLEMSFPALLSTGKDDPRLDDKDIPVLENVLGVASCTMQLTRSCFSNCGSIAAPGGNGKKRVLKFSGILGILQENLPALFRWLGSEYYQGLRPGQPMKTASVTSPRLTHPSFTYTECCAPYEGEFSGPNCEFGVIGPVYDAAAPDQLKYGYWCGTSFAAPIVAGLAALHISQSCGGAAPGLIRQIIENTVLTPPGGPGVCPAPDDGLGKGIIHIEGIQAQNPDQHVKQAI